jgi:hypothetical protein
VVAIPVHAAQRDIGFVDVAREQSREQHPVVADLRFCSDDGRLEAIGRMGHQLFAEPDARHAVADDEELFPHAAASEP